MRSQIHHLVADAARADSSHPAVTFKNETLTYGELWGRTGGTAAMLRSLGLEAGARVAIYLDKRPETVLAMFGASLAGGVFVPINPLLRPRQVAHIMNDCDVKILVTS